jgi:uncharacterized protein YozE (UPF0346 family)
MIKKFALYLIMSLVASLIIGIWWNYVQKHPNPDNKKVKQELNNRIQNDPAYKQVKDYQDIKDMVTE